MNDYMSLEELENELMSDFEMSGDNDLLNKYGKISQEEAWYQLGLSEKYMSESVGYNILDNRLAHSFEEKYFTTKEVFAYYGRSNSSLEAYTFALEGKIGNFFKKIFEAIKKAILAVINAIKAFIKGFINLFKRKKKEDIEKMPEEVPQAKIDRIKNAIKEEKEKRKWLEDNRKNYQAFLTELKINSFIDYRKLSGEIKNDSSKRRDSLVKYINNLDKAIASKNAGDIKKARRDIVRMLDDPTATEEYNIMAWAILGREDSMLDSRIMKNIESYRKNKWKFFMAANPQYERTIDRRALEQLKNSYMNSPPSKGAAIFPKDALQAAYNSTIDKNESVITDKFIENMLKKKNYIKEMDMIEKALKELDESDKANKEMYKDADTTGKIVEKSIKSLEKADPEMMSFFHKKVGKDRIDMNNTRTAINSGISHKRAALLFKYKLMQRIQALAIESANKGV